MTSVNVDVDLQFADGTTRVFGVNTKRLTHVRNFRPGHYAIHDNWVGRIEEVSDDVVVRFEDGTECVVKDADPERLIPSEPSSLFPDEEQCPYFPGLTVHASTAVLRAAKWTRGSYRGGRGAGVVAEILPGEITVDWLAGSGHGGQGLTLVHLSA